MSKLFDPRFTWGNVATLAVLLIGGAIAWGEFKATAQHTAKRLDALELADGRGRGATEHVKERLGDIQGDIKRIEERGVAQQRQLDRIERQLDLLNGRRAPATP